MNITKRTRLGLLKTVVLSAGIVAAIGAKPSVKPSAKTQPSAQYFSVRYEWRSGTVAPPYQYHYAILLGPDGRGQIMMAPGISSEGQTPSWTEDFAFPPAASAKLRKMMRARGVFSRRWTEATGMNRPVGGSSEELQVRANNHTFVVPAFLNAPQPQADAQAIYAAVNALVPKAARARLEAKREEYTAQ